MELLYEEVDDDDEKARSRHFGDPFVYIRPIYRL